MMRSSSTSSKKTIFRTTAVMRGTRKCGVPVAAMPSFDASARFVETSNAEREGSAQAHHHKAAAFQRFHPGLREAYRQRRLATRRYHRRGLDLDRPYFFARRIGLKKLKAHSKNCHEQNFPEVIFGKSVSKKCTI